MKITPAPVHAPSPPHTPSTAAKQAARSAPSTPTFQAALQSARSEAGSSNPQSVIKDLARRYDVTSMSDRQQHELAGELRKAGMISELEYADMTVVLKPVGGAYHPDAPSNIVTRYQTQLSHARIYSTPGDAQMLEHLTGILQALARERA